MPTIGKISCSAELSRKYFITSGPGLRLQPQKKTKENALAGVSSAVCQASMLPMIVTPKYNIELSNR